jgi:hypothetical protein
LAQDTNWDAFRGKSIVWLTMDGLGTIDDNILDLPNGEYRAAGIRAFDSVSGRWLIWWLDGRNPTRIDPPVLGRFEGDGGVFTGEAVFDGNPILVRFRWHDIHGMKPNWDQAFSADAGRSWEINWTNAFMRTSERPSPLSLVDDRPHDFDFLVGEWEVSHRRLSKRLVGSDQWQEFDGRLINWPVLGGNGNVGDNVMNFPGGTVRGVGIRAFDPASAMWSSWWLDGRSPTQIGEPLRGEFAGEAGVFHGAEITDGHMTRTRVIWSDITRRSARWEQSASLDGVNWEVNWVSEFRRTV